MRDFIEILQAGQLRRLIRKDEILDVLEAIDGKSVKVKLKSNINGEPLNVNKTFAEFKALIEEN